MAKGAGFSRFGKRLEAMAQQVTEKKAIDSMAELIRVSPVDSGRFRANWQLGTSIASGEVDSVSIPLVPVNLPTSRAYYITNNVPYGARLNDGYSKQAPTFFVQTAVKRVANQ